MSLNNHKKYRPQKKQGKKQNTVKTVQSTEPGTHVPQVLELLDRELKITRIHMLKALMKRWITWAMLGKQTKKESNGNAGNENTVTDIKNDFYELTL